MGKTLVIAEKPSVGADLARALPGTFSKEKGWLESDSYVVTWAVGHLLGLASPEELDSRFRRWRMADLPILPAEFPLVPIEQRSGDQLGVVLELLRRDDVERVINACDAGREGELIFAYIWQEAGVDKPVERLWISSLTQRAIRDGFDRLRPAADLTHLEQAARSRSEADWLVGMNATRAATIRGRSVLGGSVSLGRVQTPTLALIASREREIQAFVPQDYWLVGATFATAAQTHYEGRWFSGDATRLPSAERAEALVALVSGQPGTIASVERREQTEAPPLLYDLTSLQRDANRRYGFPAARTLRAAQSLYEDKKALTYPRTSSRYLSSDLVPQLKPTAECLEGVPAYHAAAIFVLGLEQLPLGRVVDDTKITDHHAIIPTVIEHSLERFGDDERRVFELVARRFLAVFHPAARYARTTVVTEVAKETFRTRGRVTLEIGWRGVYETTPDESTEAPDDEDERAEVPLLEPNQVVHCTAASSEQRTTRPPARYNDATLLSAMETAGKLVDDEALRDAMKDSGLGTPATRAETIETLIKRDYLERNGRELTPTPKGLHVITVLDGHPLTSPELTGEWERRLRDIEQGRSDRPTFMRDIAAFTRQTVEQLAELHAADLRPERVVLGLCPRCGAQTGEVIRESRQAFGCTSWKSKDNPGCGFTIWKRVAGRTLTVDLVRQLLADGRTREPVDGLKTRGGKRFRARLLLEPDGRLAFDLPARQMSSPGAEAAAAEPGDEGASPTEDSRQRPAAWTVSTSGHTEVGTAMTGRVPRVETSDSTESCAVSPGAAPVQPWTQAAVPEAAPPLLEGVDPADYLRQAGLEVIDRRPGGSLWVVAGDSPSPAIKALAERGISFKFAPRGGSATKRRPGWWWKAPTSDLVPTGLAARRAEG